MTHMHIIITIPETNLTPNANTPKVHNFTTVHTDRLHKAGSLHSSETTLHSPQQTYLSTINTYKTELQMVMAHINNTDHITIANMYISPPDSTSMHYKTADTDIQHGIQYITNIPHSVLTRDVNSHSTLWHSYTDAHRGPLIADVISNSDPLTTKHQPETECQTTHYSKHHHHGVQHIVQPDIVDNSTHTIIKPPSNPYHN